MPLRDAIASVMTATGRACRTLKGASFFAVGPIGPAARITACERALIRILREPGATAILLQLLPRATPAGQLYALLGLRQRGHKGVEELFNAYRGRTDEVRIQTGCFGGSRPVRDIVARIAEGAYLLEVQDAG